MLKRLINMMLSLGVLVGLAFVFVSMVNGKQLEITVTEQQVQQAVAGSFPMTRKIMQLTDLKLENPRINLDDKLNRINARLETRLQLQGIPFPVKGHIIASGQLDYHPETATFTLRDIEIIKIEVKGLPNTLENRVRDGVTIFTKEVLNAVPVYRLSETEFKERAAKLVLKKVRIEQGKMVLTMGMGI